MQIKPWWIYRTRGGKHDIFDRADEPSSFAIPTRWIAEAHHPMREGWEGHYLKPNTLNWLGPCLWGLHGNLDERGALNSLDLVAPLISARDLVDRKLNPPSKLAVAVEAKKAEEVLFDAA